MTAVLTDALKRIMLDTIYTNISDSAGSTGQLGAGNYYIGIGKSQNWDSSDTPVATKNSLREERNMRLNLQSIKQAESVSYVVPRNNWASNNTYSAYDDDQVGYPANNPYYVLTEDSNVYICLQQGKTDGGIAVPSTVKPTSVLSRSVILSDGYIWKFLFTVSAADRDKYLSSNFMPVKQLDSDDPLKANWVAADSAAFLIQDSALSGQIGGVSVLTGGTGFTSIPTVTITGNGDSAAAYAVISGGAVVDIKIDSAGNSPATPRTSTSIWRHGYGYTDATVTISGGGGSGATARANISPAFGFGADSRIDLKSSALMFNTKPSGDESGKFLIGQDFRQIALIKNPRTTLYDSAFGSHFGIGHGAKDSAAAGSYYTAESGLALNKMVFSGATSPVMAVDEIILGGTSGAKAYVDFFDANGSDPDFIYYHQDETTGFVPFTNGEAISTTNGDGAGTCDSAATIVDINRLAGDILYIENRASIDRSSSQTEDIKVIIQI